MADPVWQVAQARASERSERVGRVLCVSRFLRKPTCRVHLLSNRRALERRRSSTLRGILWTTALHTARWERKQVGTSPQSIEARKTSHLFGGFEPTQAHSITTSAPPFCSRLALLDNDGSELRSVTCAGSKQPTW